MSAPVFARHETFHPRYGWLKKGFDAACADPGVFLRDDAHVQLGVGKNMVRAIRYWCHAFKLLDDGELNGRARTSEPSAFGKFLLGDGGADPYLEDTGSLWLLHWKLLQPPCSATAWWWAFFIHARPEISVDGMTTGLAQLVAREFPSARTAESSLRKDATCIVRMYGELQTTGVISEESIHCPFAELSLLQPVAPSLYRFRFGRKPTLTDELIAAACLQFAATEEATSGVRTVSVARLLHDPGSPGLAFKLTESALYSSLETIAARHSAIHLTEAGGIVQLSFDEPPDGLADVLIHSHYESRRGANIG